MSAYKQNPASQKIPARPENSKTKAGLVPAILIIGVCGAAAFWLWQNHERAPDAQAATTPPAPEAAPAQEEPRALEPDPGALPAAPQVQAQEPAQNQPPQRRPAKSLQDPAAREALALVGRDEQAEQYWLKAIFNSSLPNNERADLMEDLNEVGFPDLKKLTLSDLPLIESRLQIIESVRPNADAFMKKHLDEAYKDLSKMHSKIIGQ